MRKIEPIQVKDVVEDVINTNPIQEPKQTSTIFREFTWKCFLNHFKITNRKAFIQNEFSLINVATVFNYFTEYEAFFKSPLLVKDMNNPSFDKGLLIVGGYGNGKTSILRAFESLFAKYNFTCRYKLVNTQDMVMEWEQLTTQEQKKQFHDKYMCKILCIDDAKKERKASNYGISEIVGDILVMRYNKGLKTHISCNYVPKDETQDLRNALLEFTRYGEHFYDRIFEMFNIVEFKGKSFR